MMPVTQVVGKTLGEILAPFAVQMAADIAAQRVTGLALDSRGVRAGDLFLAYPGERSDGRDHIAQAIAAGAAAVAAEPGFEMAPVSVPLVPVPNLRARVSAIADTWFDRPSAAMTVVGVTGTNGKTSITQLLGQALRLLGRRCGVVGTLGNSLDGRIDGGGLTTPDPVALQQQLADWRGQQVRYAAMEVSSHGLAQDRVAGVHFRGAVFTNLTRDHLDFHGTMAEYGAAKAALFDMPGLQFAVINVDDAFGSELTARLQSRLRVIDYSLREPAMLSVRNKRYELDGVRAQVIAPWGEIALHARLLGDFNLGNLLAVVAVLGELDISARDIESVLPRLQPIIGRMQRVAVDKALDPAVEVVVDYAHTPDALEHALLALRRHTQGQLWCVFGCGGDRDRGKRPQMGEIAARLAERVVITSDNPRSEDPAAIIAEIRAGVANASVHTEIDRAAAIRWAVQQAQPGDIVLIAGKGHEDYQVIAGQRLPFSDAGVAQTALQARAQR
jgi:UDP-N-acetylmuramoyl-L-alanyl-D-glutamate--2,6-diaminopimelate ligase